MAFGSRRLLLPFALLLTGFFDLSDASDLLDTLGCKSLLSRQVSEGQNFTFLNGSTTLSSLSRLWPSGSLICEWLNGTVKENYLKCTYGNLSVILINVQRNDSGIYQLNNGPCINLTVTGDLSSTSPSSTDQAEPSPPPTPPHSPRSRISLAIPFVVIPFVAVLFVCYLYRSRKRGENTNDNIQSYCKVAQNGKETSAPTHVTTGDCIDSVKVF
eukprot:XP_017945049.1 PREDICTED: uncharacterized protein LOC733945 isoform X1 [Xenopus tropicalis]